MGCNDIYIYNYTYYIYILYRYFNVINQLTSTRIAALTPFRKQATPRPGGSHRADSCQSLGRDFDHGLGTSGMETWANVASVGWEDMGVSENVGLIFPMKKHHFFLG